MKRESVKTAIGYGSGSWERGAVFASRSGEDGEVLITDIGDEQRPCGSQPRLPRRTVPTASSRFQRQFSQRSPVLLS